MIISIATGPWLPVPPIQGGAVHRRWQGLAEEFAKKNHQVRIVCRAYPGQPPTEIINGVTYLRKGGFSQSTNIKIDLIKDLVYALTTLPHLPPSDILVINDFWLPVFAPLRSQLGKIVINCARFPKGQYWLYARTDKFYATSNAVKKAILEEFPSAANRLNVIPNTIDTKTFSPVNKPKLTKEETLILYVGRIHPEKGIHLLLDAFSILSKVIDKIKLRIIGPFEEHQGGGGEVFLKKLKFQSQGLNVEFLDPIFDVKKLADAYRQADLFCYPSLAEKGESFGVAPLEAMASGLVPVVSDLACFRDFITEDKTGYFFDHRSSEAAKNLATVLKAALDNIEKTNEISINAIRKASYFSYENVASMYLASFEELLK